MNSFIALSAILGITIVSAQLTSAFIIDPKHNINNNNKPDLSTALATKTSTGFDVQIGNTKSIVIQDYQEDCGHFSYPSNGSNYGNNEDVAFLVQPQTSGPRQIFFPNFNTESGFDYVRVFVWENNQFTFVGSYSGSNINIPIINAPQGRFLISFKSDSSIVRPGFTASWFKPQAVQVQEKSLAVVPNEDISIPILTDTASGLEVAFGERTHIPVIQVEADCGSFGSFSYPEGGVNYQNHEDVAFLFNSDSKQPREVAFSRFDTESNFDFVTVFVWQNNQFNLAGRYSGTQRPASIVAPEGRFLISFTSDLSYTRTGFSLVFYNN